MNLILLSGFFFGKSTACGYRGSWCAHIPVCAWQAGMPAPHDQRLWPNPVNVNVARISDASFPALGRGEQPESRIGYSRHNAAPEFFPETGNEPKRSRPKRTGLYARAEIVPSQIVLFYPTARKINGGKLCGTSKVPRQKRRGGQTCRVRG